VRAAAAPRPSALLLLAGVAEPELARLPGVSVGIMSASQGTYTETQLLLDVSQGARVASSAYPHSRVPGLSLSASGSHGVIEDWAAATRRAADAPQILTPGLLGGELQGTSAYVGATGVSELGAVAVAGRDGQIGTVSLGARSSLLSRIEAAQREHSLVAADLPEGRQGIADLRALASAREASELMIVIQRVGSGRSGQLLWSAVAGIGPQQRELTSATTNERGLIASVDVAPTILAHLGPRSLPEEVRGKAIEADGRLAGSSLRSLMARLRVVGGRRIKALGCLLLAWALLLIACAHSPSRRGWAMRVGGIGVLWAPVAVLIPAALEPSAPLEYAIIVAACLTLGALSDWLLAWPRAPIAPALASLVAITADALAHTELLVRSLLGPNPILGARFYGVGNELKSALAVMTLAAVAAAMHPGHRGRRAALAFAATGVVLAVIEGSARIGAGVGGVILVSAGFAVASILMLSGALSRRRALIVLLSPIAGLVLLAAIDLLTAHGGGHYTGSVLHAHSAGELRDIIVRRYKAAWGELHNHGMPLATALALTCGAVGIRRRARLLAPVAANSAWIAAFAGGFTAALVGALAEDSGPVLLVVGVFALGCLASYLWGVERVTKDNPDTPHAERSRAPTPPAARVG
jgi:hypothetical protein